MVVEVEGISGHFSFRCSALKFENVMKSLIPLGSLTLLIKSIRSHSSKRMCKEVGL